MRTCGGCVARNLIALPIRFCSSWVSSAGSPATPGERVGGHRGARSSSSGDGEVLQRARREQVSRSTSAAAVGAPADAGEGQQVVDELLHPFRAVDGEGDVLVGPLVELPGVPTLEHLAEARDLAQRLLQVVRRDIGELLEVAVGSQPARRPGPRAAPGPPRSRRGPPRPRRVGRRCRVASSSTSPASSRISRGPLDRDIVPQCSPADQPGLLRRARQRVESPTGAAPTTSRRDERGADGHQQHGCEQEGGAYRHGGAGGGAPA